MLYWGKNPNGGILMKCLVSGNCAPVHLKQQLTRHVLKPRHQIPPPFDFSILTKTRNFRHTKYLADVQLRHLLSPPGVLSLSCCAYGSRACYIVQGSSRAWAPALKHVWRGDLRTDWWSVPRAASLPSLVQLRQEILIETLDPGHLEDQSRHFLQLWQWVWGTKK